jgi:hypothetical protein
MDLGCGLLEIVARGSNEWVALSLDGSCARWREIWDLSMSLLSLATPHKPTLGSWHYEPRWPRS